MDAMIALSVMIMIILTVAFVRFETILPEKRYEKLNYMAEDTINLLEYLEVHEIQDTPTIKYLMEKGELEKRDLNKTVLDLIASFWYKGNYSIAENISRDVLQGLTDDVCLNLTVGTETIYSSCDTPTDKVAVATRIESGYEPGKPGYGYVAAARLTDIRGKRDSSYVYFGGYVGEGNITRILELPPYDEILEAYMEMNVNSNFTLYINGNYSGYFSNGTTGGGNMTADKWIVCNETYHPEYCLNFTEGNNTLEFNFTANDSYIGGGYFKVTYNTKQLAPPKDPNKDWYWFPGIKGFINLYSSFYVPGQLNNITMRLHYFNNLIFDDYGVPLYVTIADKEVFRSDEIGEQNVMIPYNDIWQKFGIDQTILENYISNKTVPITFGTDSFYLTGKGVADAVLITDVSGSMNDCDVDSASCLHPDCYWRSGCQNRRLDVAKDVDRDFIGDILKIEGNRVGLVAYSAEPGIRSMHDLTEDKDSLIDQINNYNSDGCTCISCGIDEATNILSNPRIDKEFIDEKRIWLYNTSYPTNEPPNDVEGDSWKETDYNDTDWGSGKAILGFENVLYDPNVDTDIGNNFVLVSDKNYNASNYLLVDTSITGGILSDTYSVDGNTFDILQEGTMLIGEGSTQTKTCSCSSTGCYCDITFNNFLDPACNLDTASIKVGLRGDFNADNEYITVYTDGTNRGNCCRNRDCGQCLTDYSDCNSYSVTSYVSDNSLTVRCDASSSVDYCNPFMDCQVNLTWTENCPKSKGEVWFNSSTISYTELPGSIKAMIKFNPTEAGNYQILIYNFNTSKWESTDCDSGSVEAGTWNDYWCNRTWNIKDYISNDDRIVVALNGSSDNQATMKIDFVQYYITVGEGDYYFRKHFNVDNVSAINNASLYVLSDDRAEIYLNGYLIDNDPIEHQAQYWNRPTIITEPILIDISYFVEGDNVVAVKLYNDDSESAKFDLKLIANINETRKKAMLVMSDGEANTIIPGNNGCEYQYSDEAKIEAINKACEARNNYDIEVYAVAFGNSADDDTLKQIACWNCSACNPDDDLNNDYCWLEGESYNFCSRFYNSSNADELEVIYRRIAEEILEFGYAAQKVNITGDVALENILYTDSFIEYNFTPLVIVDPDEHGKVSITREGQRLREFTGENFITDPVTETKEGWYNISEGVTVVDAKITSYSSEFWTDRLLINSSATLDWITVYNLSDYSRNYRTLGDPYIIQIPVNYVTAGKNSLRVGAGYSTGDEILGVGGSPDDRLIYTMRIKGRVGYNETFRTLEEAIEDAKIRLNDTIKVYGIYVDEEDIDVDYKSFAGVRSIWGPSLLKIIMWENNTI